MTHIRVQAKVGRFHIIFHGLENFTPHTDSGPHSDDYSPLPSETYKHDRRFYCDATRTPSASLAAPCLSPADDLAAHPLKSHIARNADMDWTAVDEVIYGAANPAGGDNRNIARMALLLAGLPQSVQVNGQPVMRVRHGGVARPPG